MFLTLPSREPAEITLLLTRSPSGTIKIGNNTFQANYEGRDENDLTLTVAQ